MCVHVFHHSATYDSFGAPRTGVSCHSSRGASWPMGQTCVSCVSCISRQILYHCATNRWGIYIYIYMVKVLVAQLCPTLWDPMNCSPSSPSVHGFLQAKILEWIVILFSKGSSWPRDQTRVSRLQAVSLPFAPPGKPINTYISPPFGAFLLPLLPSI